jgi:asparagine synthetase B (glutamine-hydrolysing)
MSDQPDRYSDQTLHTFSIGLEGAPDLEAAQQVADMIGTIHHGFTFTVQEGLDAVRDVVYYIESFEQIRASVPMYILSRKIKALGYKVRSDLPWQRATCCFLPRLIPLACGRTQQIC